MTAFIQGFLVYFSIGCIVGPISMHRIDANYVPLFKQMGTEMKEVRKANRWIIWVFGCFLQMCMTAISAIAWPIVGLGALIGSKVDTSTMWEDGENGDD